MLDSLPPDGRSRSQDHSGSAVQLCFETFALDQSRRELRRSGELVAVEPQVFDLLVYLVQNRDRVVSKDDILAAVWHGRIVSDSTLTSRINAARRALDDSGDVQRLIRTAVGRGIRFVGHVHEADYGGIDLKTASPPTDRQESIPKQSVTFCKTADGINLAVATVGKGPLLVKTANWLNHVEHDWQSPVWAPMLQRLAARFRLVRYDGRGNGLSDHDLGDVSFAEFERDLEAVVEGLELDRFSLLGMSQGAAIAVAYAARFPDRVSRLMLYGAYPLGRNQRGNKEDNALAQALLTIMRQGWGDANSAFMRAFSSIYLPEASAEEISWFAQMQRVSASAENAVKLRIACDNINIIDLLPKVQAPTLVLHSRHDNVVSFDQGRLIAKTIPNARFVALESKNHVLVPNEPAWARLMDEIETFLAE